jgi:DNA-binding NtrC family response regulator
MKNTVLLIDAAPLEAQTLEQVVHDEQHDAVRVSHPREAWTFVDRPVALVICDLRSGREASFDLLRQWSHRNNCPPFVLLVDAGDTQAAVDGMKLGAADCLIKPIDPHKVRELTVQLLKASNNGYPQPGGSQEDGPRTDAGNKSHGLEIPEGTSLEDLERAAVQQALEQHSGNRTHAARELGISVRTLQRKLKAWRLPILSLHHYSAGPGSMSHSGDH